MRVLVFWSEASTPGVALALTLAAAALTAVGGTIGGSLAYDYGFNVETAGDSPVWHRSEVDLLPGDEPPAAAGGSGSVDSTTRPDPASAYGRR